MRNHKRWLIPLTTGAWLLGAGCAPEVLSMDVGNPARGGDAAGAMQAYEVPPYRQDHRYEATLEKWTASSLAFRIHLVNADRCGQPSNYAFQLVDDRGANLPVPGGWRRSGRRQSRGTWGRRSDDASVDGAFPAAVGAQTRFVVLRIPPDWRPRLHGRRFPLEFQGLSGFTLLHVRP